MKTTPLSLAVLAAAMAASPARAQNRMDGPWSLGGGAGLEVSEQAQWGRGPADAKGGFLSEAGLRPWAAWNKGSFEAVAAWDLAWRSGSYFGSGTAPLAARQEPLGAQSWGHILSEGPRHRLDQRFYRLYAGWSGPLWALRIGAQRHEWSEGRFYSAVDFLHLHQPLDLSPELEPLDSVYGRLGPIELELAPRPRANDTAALLRVRSVDAASTKLDFFLGKAKEEREAALGNPDHPRLMMGAAARQSLGDLRLTAEAAQLNSNLSPDFNRVLLAAAWGREGSEKGAVEYFFNGQGSDPSLYNRARVYRGDWGVLGRNYLAVQVGTRERVRALRNLDDKSWMLELSERWALGTLRVWAGLQFFGGDAASEYGPLSTRAWLAFSLGVLPVP